MTITTADLEIIIGAKANAVMHTIEFTFGVDVKSKYINGTKHFRQVRFFDIDEAISAMKEKLEDDDFVNSKHHQRYVDRWNDILDELIHYKEVKEDDES